MPLYEFQCKNCGQISELLMKINDPNPEACASCHEGPLVKLMSRTNFVLKGQGWYETDFKKKPQSKSDEKANGSTSEKKTSEPAPSSEPASSSESSSERKSSDKSKSSQAKASSSD